MQHKLITDLGELNKAIDAWGKRGAGWVKDGQTLALSALQRLHDHGDIGPCNRMQGTMPRGTKSGSMAAWLLQFGALTANTGADKREKPFLFDREKAARMGCKADMAGAAACPWETCGRPEEEPDAVFDVARALDSLLNRVMKAAQATHPEAIAKIKELREHLGEAHPGPVVLPPADQGEPVAESAEAAYTQADETAALAGVSEEPAPKARRVRKADAEA
jgi:hypothetical protein